MSLTLSSVKTFFVSLSTLDGIVDIGLNLVAIIDWLTVHHRVPFIAGGVFLWAYPGVFTWPVLPFKRTSLWTLHMLGLRKVGFAQRDYYGGTIPKYSTFSKYQAAGGLENGRYTEDNRFWEDGRKPKKAGQPLYARLLGWIAGILAVRAFFTRYDSVLRPLELGELATRLHSRLHTVWIDQVYDSYVDILQMTRSQLVD
ncbi:hypothetical protein FIBSPDRAFT_1035852 [Athelia psychrophila]|uniref:Uncharacterized protein n=1 Tax=Athelia psychrophila TaxID=1759441 RepID=A0A166WLR9_9AGAM|nr:hypothetical protein FIBSPDRAFT_1035852 [Fibularhizoctonia sp. CBS 109695]